MKIEQLNFNFLGKIFGKKGVRLTDQGLLIDTKKELVELISFSEVKRFAYIEEGFFGATLFVHNHQSLQEWGVYTISRKELGVINIMVA